MSDEIPIAPGEAPDMTAAELALGLLDGAERAAALRRVLADRDFAVAVESWRGHLAQLFDLWPEVKVSDDLLARIERSLDAPLAPLATTDAPAPRRWLWPAMTGLSSLAAAALLLVLVTRPEQPVRLAPTPVATASAPSTMLVAAIAPTGGGAPVTAVYDPGSGGMRITPQALADARRSAELWVIAGDGVPHSLGVLPASGGSMSVSDANRARMATGATLAVTLEPIGGSPTGAPTGPVVAKGALARV
ncbi:anti-sigma factor [Sphingomonas sp. RT2P30]|uniref:anti-sigma factor n=1 Tax=Parasphingomonas halimpatiens TaxID=3096162 RepID=UPI002FCC4847